MNTLLTLENLQICFQNPRGVIQAVRGVSLELSAGETLAVVGESGCGKSVLCKSILGLLPHKGRICGGNIFFDGRELTALSEKELQVVRGKEIAMVFQNPAGAFNSAAPVGKQIAGAVRGKHSRAEAAERAMALMESVGIDRTRYGQYPHQLSGGMLQRCALAAALAGEPKLLIADEPTTALDVTTQAKLLDLMVELQHKMGIAILFVTHDLGVAAQIADRVAVMYAGKVVEIGTAQDVFYDPRHPYTWGLLSSLPCAGNGELLSCIAGEPPMLICPPSGDAFAPRNRWAMKIDFREEPPMLRVSDSHFAATWLLHPDAPKRKPPVRVREGRVIVDE